MEGGGGVLTSPHKRGRTNITTSQNSPAAGGAPQGDDQPPINNAEKLIKAADRNLAEFRQVAEGSHPNVATDKTLNRSRETSQTRAKAGSNIVPRLALESAAIEQAREAELKSSPVKINQSNAKKPPLTRNV